MSVAPVGFRRTAFGLLPTSDRVELEWLLEDGAGDVRDVIVRGEATSYPGRVEIDAFECVDAKTGKAVEMDDLDRERAEEDLRDTAITMWGRQ